MFTPDSFVFHKQEVLGGGLVFLLREREGRVDSPIPEGGVGAGGAFGHEDSQVTGI